MENQRNNSNGTPLVIIGTVFLVALVAGWWFYSTSKSKPAVGNSTTATSTNTPNTNEAQLYASAPLGAQPPNILGSQTSPVVVEEFADYQCPTCGLKYPIIKQITSIYNNQIKFIFRNFPLVQMHPKAYDAAIAAEAAGMQNKFWDMQNILFTKQADWTASTDHRKMFNDYAQEIGLDVPKFQADMLGLPVKQRVDADLARAQALRISSTPTILVNGSPVPFPQMTVEGIRQIIDAELQKTAGEQKSSAAGDSLKPKAETESNK